jgi:hypothetical protein
MKRKGYKILLGMTATAMTGAALFGGIHAVHAVNILTTLPGQSGTPSTVPPGTFINALYTWALSISGILAFGIIVYGGVKYMISAGNSSGTSDAKEWIKAAILGVLLLAGAYFILNIVNPNLLNLSLPSLNNVTSAPATINTCAWLKCPLGTPTSTGVGNDCECKAPPGVSANGYGAYCGGIINGPCPNASSGAPEGCENINTNPETAPIMQCKVDDCGYPTPTHFGHCQSPAICLNQNPNNNPPYYTCGY